MRTLWMAAALGACAMISGCNQTPDQRAQVAAPAPVCACRPTPPQEIASVAPTAPLPPVAVHRHHHRWRTASRGWRGDYSRTDFTQSVQEPYDYVSTSSVSYTQSNSGYGDYGYRRRPMRDTIAATMTGERLDPWHGYGAHCDR